ncbi:MAG: hypothetical protein ACREMY_07190 [bacterium]
MSTTGPIVFAFVLLALGFVCLWRPDLVQLYAIRALSGCDALRREPTPHPAAG